MDRPLEMGVAEDFAQTFKLMRTIRGSPLDNPFTSKIKQISWLIPTSIYNQMTCSYELTVPD